MSATVPKINDIVYEFEDLKKTFMLEEKEGKILELEGKTTDPQFWNDQESAKKIMQQFSDLKSEVESFKKLESEIYTLRDLITETDSDYPNELLKVNLQLRTFITKSYLSGDYDIKNATVSIHAGQGGVEAMDWASMLYRMYVRFSEKRGWKSGVIDISEGEEAGIKSITFKIEGSYAYGYLKGESGTHRLVRQSPFNADRLRQTSFALVEVLPELQEVDLPDIQINEEDVEWQFFRASSQGGQNVQKVSSAVRLTHKPSGIVVTAQAERFQEQNRKIALNLLRSKLWLLEQAKENYQKQQIKGEYKPASWGNQIRSYVLHPYKMIKDLRTEIETANTEAVLNGEIEEFIEAEVKIKINPIN